jgi:hypothetical protein
MKEIDARLDKMIEFADQTGVTLDEIIIRIGRISQRDFEKLSDNPSLLPRYMKSKVTPS